jgi:hypothetical protein
MGAHERPPHRLRRGEADPKANGSDRLVGLREKAPRGRYPNQFDEPTGGALQVADEQAREMPTADCCALGQGRQRVRTGGIGGDGRDGGDDDRRSIR